MEMILQGDVYIWNEHCTYLPSLDCVILKDHYVPHIVTVDYHL